MNLNRWFTVITLAGLAGLVILNAKSAADVVNSLSQATNSYVTTVQGRSTGTVPASG